MTVRSFDLKVYAVATNSFSFYNFPTRHYELSLSSVNTKIVSFYLAGGKQFVLR
jgi:hypothetical protein